jgi:DNA repair photolyase
MNRPQPPGAADSAAKAPGARTVLSASRRTELVAHYPDRLAAALEAFGPERVHTLVVWTKDPRNLLAHPRLRDLAGRLPQTFVHWTVTGLGGSALEPNVPAPEALLPVLPGLIEWLGSPRRLQWRFDPLVEVSRAGQTLGNLDLELFGRLAGEFASRGVEVVRTSFVTLYPKVRRRLAAAGLTAREFQAGERAGFLARMRELACRVGMQVLTCCEPGVPRESCIDGRLLAELHPAREPCSQRRARDQRPRCGCTESFDLGYYLRCPNGCLYCYAQPAGAA